MRLSSFDAFREDFLAHEREQDAQVRRGVVCGQYVGYRYVGPPLVPSSDAVIEAAYLRAVQSMVCARADAWLMRPQFEIFESRGSAFDVYVRSIEATLAAASVSLVAM